MLRSRSDSPGQSAERNSIPCPESGATWAATSSAVSIPIHDAASRIASGIPSTRWQIAATAGASASLSA